MAAISQKKAGWRASWITRNARRSKRSSESGRATSAATGSIGGWSPRAALGQEKNHVRRAAPRGGCASGNRNRSSSPGPRRNLFSGPGLSEGPGKRCSSRTFMNQESGLRRPCLSARGRKEVIAMDECVVCRRKVQRTENFARCISGAVSRLSTGGVWRVPP